jgi:hypothetical protein
MVIARDGAMPMNQQTKISSQRKRRQRSTSNKREEAQTTFEQVYPNIAQWVKFRGWIEMGQDDCNRSMARALDIGGMVWEGKAKYASLDELLHDLENGLIAWQEENG